MTNNTEFEQIYLDFIMAVHVFAAQSDRDPVTAAIRELRSSQQAQALAFRHGGMHQLQCNVINRAIDKGVLL
jgi:hypothetical protein